MLVKICIVKFPWSDWRTLQLLCHLGTTILPHRHYDKLNHFYWLERLWWIKVYCCEGRRYAHQNLIRVAGNILVKFSINLHVRIFSMKSWAANNFMSKLVVHLEMEKFETKFLTIKKSNNKRFISNLYLQINDSSKMPFFWFSGVTKLREHQTQFIKMYNFNWTNYNSIVHIKCNKPFQISHSKQTTADSNHLFLHFSSENTLTTSINLI